jgi:uncharacterized protein with von Willebrand factor type A (vWA) domain
MTAAPQPGEGRQRPGPGIAGGGPYRYARWDGRQRLPDLSADEILDEISDDLMADGDLGSALRRLLSRGFRRPPGPGGDDLRGLDGLLARLREQRTELLQRYELGDVLADVREELAAIEEAERRGIERRLAGGQPDADDAVLRMARDLAARRQRQLDELPADLGGRIRGLQAYDFLEPAARERFAALVERLSARMLDAWFEGMSQALRNATPEQLAASREMVRDLDQLLRDRLDGNEPSQERVDAFLARHGGSFPGARTLDDIVEQLASRMAAMASLLASMRPEQRAELDSMMDALLRDDRLRWDLAQLASTLDELLPGGLGQRLRFRGDEPLTLESALDQVTRIERLDAMADRLRGALDPGAPWLDDIDLDELRDVAGEDAAADLEALREIVRRLEEAGYIERGPDRMELTPRGTRRLGQRVLDQLFSKIRRDAFGGHATRRSGGLGDRAEGSAPWEFGRPFDLDLRRTLSAGLAREENRPSQRGRGDDGGRAGGPRASLTLDPSDFFVHEAEEQSDAATVLLLDMSRSMLLRGCFAAARRVAIALDTLIRTRFPRDTLHVVGFAYYAREIRPGALASLGWTGYEYGTNLQHALILARNLLARSHSSNRTIVVITDGEPTAHLEDGQVEFAYPPTRRTISETLREVARCTREGITINTIMLERSRALAAFVDRMTRLNRGRAFYADPEQLGEYVLVDYVDRRTRRA